MIDLTRLAAAAAALCLLGAPTPRAETPLAETPPAQTAETSSVETPGQRLFFEGAFNSVAAGSSVIYEHKRDGSGVTDQAQLISDGEIRVTLRTGADGAREALVAISAGGGLRDLHPYPASVGNPLLMVFLESTLRSMATITGGSPFYIRNRMKEALFRGGEISSVTAAYKGAQTKAEEIVFRPFAHDKNRHRMGAFADLELRFLLSESAPGGFLLFSSSTPAPAGGEAAYREQIVFRDLREDG